MKHINKIMMGLLAITTILFLYNSVQLITIPIVSAGQYQQGISGQSILPTGVPEIYGSELGITYDDVSAYDPYKADLTINVLKQLDKSITLSENEKTRYINILYHMNDGISCEYCCGARSIIFENGDPACGCAHSYAMRGLAKYLITEQGTEYTDEGILEEVAKWKALFFPTQIQQKASVLEGEGVDLTYTNLGSNKYRGVEQGSSFGGMVGGC